MPTLSTTAAASESFLQKNHFLLRRLHSLTGIVPIGAFLVEHMLTNSMAYGGRESFNDAVATLHGLPYLWALETFGIFMPIAFHAIFGIAIAWTSQSNVAEYPNWDNRRYRIQRLTGYVTFLFMIFHLMKFRFGHIFFGAEHFINNNDPFQLTQNGLINWSPWAGLVIPTWTMVTIYTIGLAAACFHFANGIWSFCITWGITVGVKAQKRVGALAALVGLGLFLWGSMSLCALAGYKKFPVALAASHPEVPFVMFHRYPSNSPELMCGPIVGVWADGRIVRVAWEDTVGKNYVAGKLTAEQLQQLLHFLAANPQILQLKGGEVIVCAASEILGIRLKHHRVLYGETAGGLSPLVQHNQDMAKLRQYLMSIVIAEPHPCEPPWTGLTRHWYE